MRVSVKRAIRVQLFIPRCRTTADVRRFLVALAGGYTEHPNATGHWVNALGLHFEEPVRVFDALTDRPFFDVVRRVEALGRQFLLDNPGEQCFMAYVGGRVLTIEREGETNAS